MQGNLHTLFAGVAQNFGGLLRKSRVLNSVWISSHKRKARVAVSDTAAEKS